MSFAHRHAPNVAPAAADPVVAVEGDRLLVRTGTADAVVFPGSAEWEGGAPGAPRPLLHVGLLDGQACWLDSVEGADATPPDGFEWRTTRAVLPALTPAQSQAVCCARALHWWRTRHRFCGGCGTATIEDPEQRAMRCPKCGATFFPSASPAVIVAITRGDRLLLAHNRNFRPAMFSLLAGFVEPGETLEEAAAREVREEVGVEIGDLRYVSSQPWPFPNSLMVGFRAVHRVGEIAVDGREIAAADWFARDALPDVPAQGSVARAIIDAWRRERADPAAGTAAGWPSA